VPTHLTAADAARLILQAHQHGDELVSVLATAGPAAGLRVLVFRDARIEGTLGDPALDDAARDLALRVLASRETELRDGLFAELHAPSEQLLIFGAGHIAVPLAELGVQLAFSVTVLDDRDEFASSERFPPAARVLRLDLAAPLTGIEVTRDTYVVLVTRAHAHDFDLLRAILGLDVQPRYIGMIGSRRRVRAAFTALLEGGVAREKLLAVHAPVGLDIGAETPAEIAVSIAAELIRVRRGGTAESIGAEERVLERFFSEGAS
jgi:xanthine dehydrogenase accessory factor